MTLVDRMIPYWVWFGWGFAFLGTFFMLINYGMNLVTVVTVKGLFIPLWAVPLIVLVGILICIAVGYYFEKYSVWNRITSYANKGSNPEVAKINQMAVDIQEIKKMLQERKL